MKMKTVFEKENKNFSMLAKWDAKYKWGFVYVMQNDWMYDVQTVSTKEELIEIVSEYVTYLF